MLSDEQRAKRRVYSQKLRQERASKGLCRTCGAPATPGMKSCEDCRELARVKDRERRKKRRTEKREASLCAYCDKPALEGKRTCQTHYERAAKNCQKAREAWWDRCCKTPEERANRKKKYSAEWQRNRRNSLVLRALCIYCGKEEAAIGFKGCPDCIEKSTILSIESYPLRKEQKQSKARERYQERKAAGQCTKCGKPSIPGKTLCNRCNVLAISAYHARHVKMFAPGTCPRCGAPLMEGKRICEKHWLLTCEALKKARAARRENPLNKYWQDQQTIRNKRILAAMVKQVRSGRKTIEQIPDFRRAEVQAVLDKSTPLHD